MDYIRQMYHLNVLCLEKDQCQSKSECFINLFGDLKKLETNPRSDIFLLHLFKNIKEIQSDCFVLVWHVVYKTNVSSRCFVFTRQTISK